MQWRVSRCALYELTRAAMRFTSKWYGRYSRAHGLVREQHCAALCFTDIWSKNAVFATTAHKPRSLGSPILTGRCDFSKEVALTTGKQPVGCLLGICSQLA